MHHRYSSVVATIATGLLMACGDARLDDVTAPRPAATPALPVANQYPTEAAIAEAGVPTTIGLRIETNAWFESDYNWFVVDARVRFDWANYVSATLKASLINQSGTRINDGQASMTWYRMFIPVAFGDTTFRVRVSTAGHTCGLIGRHEYAGTSAQRAIDSRLVTISLYEQNVGPTTGPDVLQPACPEDECRLNPWDAAGTCTTDAPEAPT
ncbi:MAG TPA: hypothetical protein VFZ73_03445, partial [Gemmatimonadaceae bacterium]